MTKDNEPVAWHNEAAALLARFINLSSRPDQALWGEVALDATKLLNCAPPDLATKVAELDHEADRLSDHAEKLRQIITQRTAQRDELLAALEELMYARTDKAEAMAEAAIARVKGVTK